MAYAFLLPLSSNIATKVLIPILMCLLFSHEFKERLQYILKNRIFQSFLLMLTIYTLWILGSNHIDTALFEINKLFKVFLPLLIMAMATKKEFLLKIINGFLLAMLFSTIISFCMFFQIYIPLLKLSGANVPFMMNYTQYATVISIAMGFSFFILFFKNPLSVIQKVFYSLLFILSFLNLLILNSLTGYVLLLFSCLIVYFILYPQHIKKILFFGMGIICIIYSFAYTISPTFKGKITVSIQTIKELSSYNFSSSIGVRVGFLVYSLDTIKKNPIFGIGTGDHVHEIRKKIIEQETNPINAKTMLENIPDSNGSNLHNQFLDILLQFGLLGLIAFFNIFYQIYKNKTITPYLQPLQYLLGVSILLSCFANPLFIYGDVERIFVLLVALLIRPFEQSTYKEEEQKNIHAI